MQKNKLTLKDTFIEALQKYKKRDFETSEALCNKIRSIDPNHFESKHYFKIGDDLDSALENIQIRVNNIVDSKKPLTFRYYVRRSF